LLQFSTYDDELNYVVCVFGVRYRFLYVFEQKGKCKQTITVPNPKEETRASVRYTESERRYVSCPSN